MKILFKIIIVLIIQLTLARSMYAQDRNREEFIKAIYTLEKTIWSLEGYIIDTSFSTYWTATNPTGLCSYEGERYTGNSDDYIFKSRSYITPKQYDHVSHDIKCIYYIDGIRKEELIITNSSESDDELPIDFKKVKTIYFEKIFYLPFSKQYVFDNLKFKVFYVIIFNDNSVKKYRVDPIHRTFNEYN